MEITCGPVSVGFPHYDQNRSYLTKTFLSDKLYLYISTSLRPFSLPVLLEVSVIETQSINPCLFFCLSLTYS